ncbi:hypothetical protein DCC39_10195 [Pueribacillus theae]|uniref:Homeodomain phBC6A51-type domain-containing protein n=1 Tax=Pueribacillus theae TaxID=2171751 RepID=A0A2U1K0M9_9BACI|nr:hypothetical protein [Pueribacillus theae]PWA11060.1 hypothetical protein DCC39_10195 [Pueribacillus theae]
MEKLPMKKSFEKDDTAKELVLLMMEKGFSEMPDSYKADQLGISLSEYSNYMNNPEFLRWAVKTMQDLYVARLPEVLNTIYSQAVAGKGRQQKMLLEFMKISSKDEEMRSPNIIIVNNIPNPDDQKPQVINMEEITNG